MTSILGPYSTSSALSTTHYKLVQALESARSPAERDTILDTCLHDIEDRWSRSQPKPSRAFKDLVLILYCHSQRESSGKSEAAEKQEWVLLGSVRLAGSIGVGTVRERQLGYRTCVELFPSDSSNQLKLLLINTIRSDLYAQDRDSKVTLQRIKLALRAISSDNIITDELVSAVEERVFELLYLTNEEDPGCGSRLLALEAMASLVKVNETNSNLLNRARSTVLDILQSTMKAPRPPVSRQRRSDISSSSSSSAYFPPKNRLLESGVLSYHSASHPSPKKHPQKQHHPTPVEPDQLPERFHLKLISHLSPTSILHPITPSRIHRLSYYVPLLDTFLEEVKGQDPSLEDQETNRARRRSRRSAFTPAIATRLERLLRLLIDSFTDEEKEGGQDNEGEEEVKVESVEEEIRARLEVLLLETLRGQDQNETRGLNNALILSLVETLSTIPSSSQVSFPTGVLSPLLTYLDQSLLRSASRESFDPNTRFLVLKTLVHLPPESWTGTETGGDAKGKLKETEAAISVWNEESWRILLSGLTDKDENLRRFTIHLLSFIDPNLLKLHYSQSLSSLHANRGLPHLSGSLVRLTELLPYQMSETPSPTLRLTNTRSRPRRYFEPTHLRDLLQAPTLGITPTVVFPDLVLKILEGYRYHFSRREQAEFARGLWKLKAAEGGDDESSWQGNVMLGLLMAGTIHSAFFDGAKDSSSMVESLKSAQTITHWIVDDNTNREIKEMLSEPFLFALLRIFALSYPISSHHHTLQTSIDHDLDPQISSSLSIIHLELSSLNSLRQTDRILDKQLLNFALIALGSQDNLEKLRVVGSQTKEESLAGFGQAFTETFQSIDNANHPGRPAPSNSTLRATHSPQTVNRTKFNDPSVSRTREEERGQDRIDEISRSIAALKREQAELKRERQDRAGTMSSKRKVESLMDDTNSALVGGERDESFDAESQEDDEDIKSEQERARETTFGTDENGGNEPPSSLLIEIAETLDPFHIH